MLTLDDGGQVNANGDLAHPVVIIDARTLEIITELPPAPSVEDAKAAATEAGYRVIDQGEGGNCETTDAWEHGRTLHVVTVEAARPDPAPAGRTGSATDGGQAGRAEPTTVNGFPVKDGWVSEYFVTENDTDQGLMMMPVAGPFRSESEVREARAKLIEQDPAKYTNTTLTESRTPVDLFHASEQDGGDGHA